MKPHNQQSQRKPPHSFKKLAEKSGYGQQKYRNYETKWK